MNVPLAMAAQGTSGDGLAGVLHTPWCAIATGVCAAHAATNHEAFMPSNDQGPSEAEFEFSGDAAGAPEPGPSFGPGGSGSFVGGDLDLSNEPTRQESNLGGSGGLWIGIVAVVLLLGGGVAWATIGGNSAEASESGGEPTAAAPEQAAGESASTPEPEAPTAVGTVAAEGAVAEGGPGEAPKAEPTADASRVAEPAVEPVEPSPDLVAAEPEPAEPAESTPDPKAVDPAPKKPAPGKQPSSSSKKKKKKALSTNKKPRDPLSGLPAPPG